jgi:ribonuclease HI
MQQLGLFSHEAKRVAPVPAWRLFIDGGSRGNPGPAGIGIVIYQGEEIVWRGGFFIGQATNNQAEYLALLAALAWLQHNDTTKSTCTIYADSQLLVRQMTGVYAIKDITLSRYATKARELMRGRRCRFIHVLRDKNKEADAMVNQGIDQKVPVPSDFYTALMLEP